MMAGQGFPYVLAAESRESSRCADHPAQLEERAFRVLDSVPLDCLKLFIWIRFPLFLLVLVALLGIFDFLRLGA